MTQKLVLNSKVFWAQSDMPWLRFPDGIYLDPVFPKIPSFKIQKLVNKFYFYTKDLNSLLSPPPKNTDKWTTFFLKKKTDFFAHLLVIWYKKHVKKWFLTSFWRSLSTAGTLTIFLIKISINTFVIQLIKIKSNFNVIRYFFETLNSRCS